MNSPFRLFPIAFLVCAVSFQSFSAEPPVQTVDLSKGLQFIDSNWLFTPSDQASYKDSFPQEQNRVLNVYQPWQYQAPELAGFQGIVWAEKRFQITDNSTSIGLFIPLGYGAYQLYLNGHIIVDNTSHALDTTVLPGTPPQVVHLPEALLQKGENRLTLRSFSNSGWGGFGANFLQIGTFKQVQDYLVQYLLKNVAIGFISLFLFLYFFLQFFFRRQEKYNLFFSLFCLFTGVFIVGYNGIWYYVVNATWAYYLLTFVGGINMYLMPILFIRSFFGMKKGITNKIFIGLYSFLNAFVIIEYIITGQILYFTTYVYMFFVLSYIALAIYLFVLGIVALRKKLPHSSYMFIGIVLLMITFIQSMMGFSGNSKMLPLMGEGFFAMAVVFAVVLARRFAQTHTSLELTHQNLLVESEKNLELNRTLEDKVRQRTAELQEKNALITDSIEYASLIQHAILPEPATLTQALPEHFAIWRPRDIVGGDFYWFRPVPHGFVLAVVDCTGHGVPGALLSMTTAAALDNIVANTPEASPGAMVAQLNRYMKSVLHQGEPKEMTDDGLEIGMCRYNAQQRSLTYAGSKLGLFVADSNGVVEYAGDRSTVGYRRARADAEFADQTVTLSPGATVYLPTDGYLTQNGGPKGYSFGKSRFKDLAAANATLPTSEQAAAFERALADYQGDNSQRDDITVVGFRLS